MLCCQLKRNLSVLAYGALLQGCTEQNYPSHHASFKLADRTVGCASTASQAKKENQFEALYKNHWMTWRGKVQVADADSLSIDTDGHGSQDLFVRMEKANSAYDVRKGEIVTVRFLMSDVGGCIMPFSGKKATLIQGVPESQLFSDANDYYSR